MKLLPLITATLFLLGTTVLGQVASPDEKLLKSADIATDGPGLLTYFEKQTATPDQQKALPGLIARLGSEDFRVREKAHADLIAMELGAVPALSRRYQDPDLEIRMRIRDCLTAIRKSNPAKIQAAVRLVQKRQPRGAAPVLLAYFPFAEHPGVEQAILQAVFELEFYDGKRAVPALIDALKNPSPFVRLRAGRALAYLGMDAQAAAAALADAVRDDDLKVQAQALTALENLGPAAKEAIPVLVKLLNHKDEKMHEQAYRILGQVGAGRKDVLDALKDRLVDASNKQQLYAANALEKIGPAAIPVFLDALARGPEMYAKCFSAAALCRIARDKPEVLAPLIANFAKGEVGEWTAHNLTAYGPLAVEPVSELLAHKDASIRLRAAKCLGKFGPNAQPAAVKLHAALKDDHIHVRVEAALALWSIEHKANVVLPTLLDSLKNDPDLIRTEAICSVLAQIDPLPADAVAVLIGLIKEPRGRVRHAAVKALAHAETHAKDVAPVMIEVLLNDKDWSTRNVAARALQYLGPTTPDVIPALARALSDPESIVRASAINALRSMGRKSNVALPAMIEALKDKARFREVASLLGGLGPDARDAVPILIDALDKHPGEAVLALGQIGPDAKKAIPHLIKQLKNPNNVQCQDALIRTGPDSVGPLLEALDDKNARISFQAYETLGRMGPSVVEPLRKVLANPRGYRWGAANALGMIGPEAKAAVPDLVNALNDKEGPLKRGAASALGEIGVATPDVIMALGQRVQDPDCAIYALASLAKLGPKAKAAVPQLRDALKNSGYQINAAEALIKIDPQAAEPLAILVKNVQNEKTRWYALRAVRRLVLTNKEMLDVLPLAFDDMNIFVYREASDYLAEISVKTDAALPVLIAAADHRQAWVREKSLAALGRLGPKAKAGVPVMVKALGHRSWRTRLEAAKALAQLGPAAKDATPTLKDHLHTHDPLVLPFIAEALARIDGPGDEVVQSLIKAFHTGSLNHTETRIKAAEALAELGPKAKAALPVLIDAAHDTGSYNTGHLDVRPYAAWALWKIDGQTEIAVYSLTQSLKICRGPARAKAAEALAAIGPPALGALPTLRRVLRDHSSPGREESEIRDAIAAAIKKLE